MSNCKKPNCDCIEKEIEKQGTEFIKSYPCLCPDNVGDDEVKKHPAASTQSENREKEELTAEQYLKSKGLKNPYLDSGIMGAMVYAEDPRIRASKAMEDYAKLKNNYVKWENPIDNLPKESGRYLCVVKELNDLGFSYFVWNCSYDVASKLWLDNFKTVSVIAWMHLPEFNAKWLSSPSNTEEGEKQEKWNLLQVAHLIEDHGNDFQAIYKAFKDRGYTLTIK